MIHSLLRLLPVVLGLMLTLPAFAQSFFPAPPTRHQLRHPSVPVTPPAVPAANSRSDTIDILHYTINLDITDFSGKTIAGNCTIRLVARMNGVTQLPLDLLQLQVDSVIQQGSRTFTYNDTLLRINLAAPLNTGDTAAVVVHYQGAPQQDQSGWGGFYWQGNYAFNLGVGFDANPHNYGRVWFPCFDNFVERATYDLFFTTSNGRVATSNGALIAEQDLGNGLLQRHWRMDEAIPTYLTSVAVSNYATVAQTYNGISGPVPIRLYAPAGDTNAVKNSFQNLPDALEAFETAFGPHRWNKVGYSMVPFGSGAMEHASNIAYPLSAANGSLAQETLMAHELAHSWWGNLVTCETAGDMWINEGMASFLELVFLEHVYGRERYISTVNSDHLSLLRYAHHQEGGFRSLTNMPHEYTYGDHTYVKGSIVAHTLRGYMGDAQFYPALRTFLDNNQYQSVNATQLRDELSATSGMDLTDFFDGWVLNGGWPHFAIDSFRVNPTPGLNEVTVFIRQRLYGAPALFDNVPMEVSFLDANWQEATETVTLSGALNSFTFQLPIEPVYATLNMGNKISHAVSDNQLTITAPGSYTLDEALMTLNVGAVSDSVFLRIEHHWAAPDPVKNPQDLRMRVSPNRYWKIDGLMANGFAATAQFFYDGRVTNGNAGFLDNDLIGDSEDSLHLLYRAGPHEDWVEFPYYSRNDFTNATDKFGLITMDSVWLGEYTLAVDQYNVGMPEATPGNFPIKAYPNPAGDVLYFEWPSLAEPPRSLVLHDVQGREVLRETIQGRSGRASVAVDHLPEGTYIYTLRAPSGRQWNNRVVIKY